MAYDKRIVCEFERERAVKGKLQSYSQGFGEERKEHKFQT